MLHKKLNGINTYNNSIKLLNIMVCTYCNCKYHIITSCPVDNELICIMNSLQIPKFSTFTVKLLKKLSVLHDLKSGLSKLQLINQLQNKYNEIHVNNSIRTNNNHNNHHNNNYNNNHNNYGNNNHKISTSIKSINNITDNIECIECNNYNECSICLEQIVSNDTCQTLCNHTFHLSCMMKIKNNSCPLCRTQIFERSATTAGLSIIDVDSYTTSFETMTMEDYNSNYNSNYNITTDWNVSNVSNVSDVSDVHDMYITASLPYPN